MSEISDFVIISPEKNQNLQNKLLVSCKPVQMEKSYFEGPENTFSRSASINQEKNIICILKEDLSINKKCLILIYEISENLNNLQFQKKKQIDIENICAKRIACCEKYIVVGGDKTYAYDYESYQQQQIFENFDFNENGNIVSMCCFKLGQRQFLACVSQRQIILIKEMGNILQNCYEQTYTIQDIDRSFSIISAVINHSQYLVVGCQGKGLFFKIQLNENVNNDNNYNLLIEKNQNEIQTQEQSQITSMRQYGNLLAVAQQGNDLIFRVRIFKIEKDLNEIQNIHHLHNDAVIDMQFTDQENLIIGSRDCFLDSLKLDNNGQGQQKKQYKSNDSVSSIQKYKNKLIVILHSQQQYTIIDYEQLKCSQNE